MTSSGVNALHDVLSGQEDGILAEWLRLLGEGGPRDGRIKDAELRSQCQDVLAGLLAGLGSGAAADVHGPAFAPLIARLEDISRSRALQGFSPRETAGFIFSLKQPIFSRLRTSYDDAQRLVDDMWALSRVLDDLGVFTLETYQRSREQIIARQQEEIAELSTPVVTLWEGVVALPLIGTLDSSRTQVVMENLLQALVDQQADIAIIDITGVPTVDTLVAQHLIKTVSAARLMGADCIISGIRPQIAQTMVHLGVDLNVVTKATLAAAFAIALQRTGQRVVKLRPATAPVGG
ncbi:MAG: STAS domain-containing protein [Caulobacteraceae bacterium]